MITKIVPERAGLDPLHSRDVHYGYDAGNRQLFARFNSPSGEGVTNAWDGLGRLASTTVNMGGTSRQLSYLYDPGGRRERITHPDGTQFRYQYDAGGAPTSLGTPAAWLVNASYNPAGLPSLIGRANGTGSGRTYDAAGRLTGVDLQPIPSPHGVAWGLAYNPAGQIRSIARTGNDAYAYTGAYDVSRPYAVNRLNQYHSAGPATFTHDANGNLVADGATTFLYDVENRLVSASGAPRPPSSATTRSAGSGRSRAARRRPGSSTTATPSSRNTMPPALIQRRYAHWLGDDVPVGRIYRREHRSAAPPVPQPPGLDRRRHRGRRGHALPQHLRRMGHAGREQPGPVPVYGAGVSPRARALSLQGPGLLADAGPVPADRPGGI